MINQAYLIQWTFVDRAAQVQVDVIISRHNLVFESFHQLAFVVEAFYLGPVYRRG